MEAKIPEGVKDPVQEESNSKKGNQIAKACLGVLLAVFVAFGDALTSIIMRLTKRRGIQDFQSIFWNQVAQIIVVVVLVIIVRPKMTGPSWKHNLFLVVGGLLRVTGTVCVNLSALYALPGNTWAIVYGVSPILTACLSTWLNKERPSVAQVAGMLLCGAGVVTTAVSLNRKAADGQPLQQALTLIYPVSACVLFTVCWVLLRWLSKEGVPLVTHMFYYSISGVLLLPLAYLMPGTPTWDLPPGMWGLLIIQTVAYATQYLSNAAAIHNETVTTVQILKVLTVPIVFVLGFVILQLVPNTLEVCGGTVVVVGATAVGIWSWYANLRRLRVVAPELPA